jgi:hypothetical protein
MEFFIIPYLPWHYSGSVFDPGGWATFHELLPNTWMWVINHGWGHLIGWGP